MRRIAACLMVLSTLIVRVHGAETAAPSKASAEPYKVVGEWHLGGEGRWDYATVDPDAKRLYVTRQTHVQVVDTDSGKVVGDLKGTAGVHGVALAPELHRGYASNGQGNSVTIFNLKDVTALGTTPAGQNPDAILYDPASRKVMAFNGRSNDVTALDAAAAPGAGTSAKIPLEGKPEFAVSDEAGHVYVNLEDKSSVTEIDTHSMKVTHVWKIDGGEEPSGLAIDIAHHRLFAGCGNEVIAIIDSQTGKTLQTVPIGKGVDACAFDPGTGEAFASCGDGTLTVVKETSPGKFAAVQTVHTPRGCRTMALDPSTHKIYLPTSEFEDAPAGGGRPAPKPDTFKIVVVAREK